jgi:hypothetical protein
MYDLICCFNTGRRERDEDMKMTEKDEGWRMKMRM